MAARRKRRPRRDPDQTYVNSGRLSLYFIGGGHLWIGAAMRGHGSALSDGFGGYKAIVFGVLVLSCAIWAHWRRTPTPYWVALALFIPDLALAYYISPRWFEPFLAFGTAMRALFGYYVVRAGISSANLSRRAHEAKVDDSGGWKAPP